MFFKYHILALNGRYLLEFTMNEVLGIKKSCKVQYLVSTEVEISLTMLVVAKMHKVVKPELLDIINMNYSTILIFSRLLHENSVKLLEITHY